MQGIALLLFVSHRDSQSTHLASPKIHGMTVIAERPHIKYGSAILIRSDLKVKGVSVWEQDNVELISIEMPGVVVHSVYKPPNEKFVLPTLGHGYTVTDDNGEAVEQWADSCNLTLIHNVKLNSAIGSALAFNFGRLGVRASLRVKS